MNRILFPLLSLAMSLAGCATTPPNFDVDAKESLGRITEKTVAGGRTQARADSPSADALVGTIGIVGVAIADGLFQKKTQIAIYAYRIRTADGRQIVVASESFSNEVGDCVKVFESARPTYPRFVSAMGCESR
jgi:hypothetical protein